MYTMLVVVCHVAIGCFQLVHTDPNKVFATSEECRVAGEEIFKAVVIALGEQGLPLGPNVLKARTDCKFIDKGI